MAIVKRLILDPHKPTLLTFDAFGTLFTPRKPIEKLYTEAARAHGLTGFTEEDIGTRFREAYKMENKKHRNYGKEDSMQPSDWWANVVHSAFSPYIPSSGMPQSFNLYLWNLFSSRKAYMLYPDVLPFFDHLSTLRNNNNNKARITTGIITNSDGRVPSILLDLGIKTTYKGYGLRNDCPVNARIHEGPDIDFIVMSYDTGHEKPSHKIFQAAGQLSGIGVLEGTQCVHVGDELIADYHGAVEAGWESILLKREKEEIAMDKLKVMTQKATKSDEGLFPPRTEILCIRNLWELKELLGPAKTAGSNV